MDDEIKYITGIDLSLLPRYLQENIIVTLQDELSLKKRQQLDEIRIEHGFPGLALIQDYQKDIRTTLAELTDRQALFYKTSSWLFDKESLVNMATIDGHGFYVTWKNGTPEILKGYLGELSHWLSKLEEESQNNPVHISLIIANVWAFKGYIYKFEYTNQLEHSTEEEELLVLENYDRERQKFEKLKRRYKSETVERESYHRERISEEVRIAVWRRDDGKCARCGSRENLEYDHIVPVSKGGGNTARNIELLCESCNRKKSSNIE